ncbi:FUSC family protein [Actinomycetospora atypica]|uniref:Aromatic acid exporter family protein n=1 Tax=Actinomycetospora atypica TaxID=1290095 RepID=A0ABV9YMC3_9PSEU
MTSVVERLRVRAHTVAVAAPTEGRVLLRILVAAAVAWELCVRLGATQPPVFAVIVPLVALRDAPDTVFDVSLGRVVGVVAGLAIGVGVLSLLRPGTLAVVLVLGVALAVGVVLRVAGALNVQVAVSALLVFANTDPSAYAVSRLWETAVGAAVTIVLAPLLLPTNPVRSFRRELDAVAQECADHLRAVADLLAPHPGPTTEELRDRTRTTEVRALGLAPKLATARRAVRLNPLWRRRYRHALDPVTSRADAAAEVAASVRLYADDVAELAGREDVRAWWDAMHDRTRTVVLALADTVAGPLAGQASPGPGHVRDLLAAHRDADPTTFGAVVRRPLVRITRVLDRLAEADPVVG